MRARFVCARITKMNDQDIARFEFDFDTTWCAFFLDPELNIYSRYGGRDHREPEERMGKESLLQTMQEVLDIHGQRAGLRPLDRAQLLHPAPERQFVPDDIPFLEQNHSGCLHCHQLREYRLLQWSHDGEFDRQKLFCWPLPENVGLHLEHAHGHRVETVDPESAAAVAGVQPGDVVTRINDVPIRSELDMRWAFDRAADSEPLRFVVQRFDENGTPHSQSLELQPQRNWRVTDLSWRKSLRSLPLEWGLRAYELSASQRKKEGFDTEGLAIRVTWVGDRGLGNAIGLQKQDVITALDGQSAGLDFEELKSQLLARFGPGDAIRVKVLRAGSEVELTGQFPPWHTTENTVP